MISCWTIRGRIRTDNKEKADGLKQDVPAAANVYEKFIVKQVIPLDFSQAVLYYIGVSNRDVGVLTNR